MSIIAYIISRSLPVNGLQVVFDGPSYLGIDLSAKMRNPVWNLSIPWPHQYLLWLQQLLSGTLGPSFYEPRPAAQLIAWALGPSFVLIVIAMTLTVLIGIPIGIFQGVHRESPADHVVTGLTYVLMACPPYVLALTLMWVFSVVLGWFPVAGVVTLSTPFNVWDVLHHIALPAATIALANIAMYARYMRMSILDQLPQDYIRTAHSKGLLPSRITWHHVMPNAVMPVLMTIATNLAQIMSTVFIIEIVFEWPGIATLFVQAVYSEDYNVLMAILVGTGMVVMVTNLIADVIYAMIDPRVTYA